MSDDNSGRPRGPVSGKPGDEGDFQRAVGRLEGAVDELVTMAKEQFSDRATSFVQDAADRMEQEIESRRGRQGRRRSSRSRHRQGGCAGGYSGGPNWMSDMWSPQYWGMRPGPRSVRDNPYRTRKLYRDVRHQRIAGVCAGIARYFGMEAWVVRCIAATGLIFMGQIVVPAYVIAWWVLEPAPNSEGAVDAQSSERKPDHTSPAPELGPRLSPRRSLRDVQWSLDQIELKLRRMETHVTSGQYELQRELRKIDT